MRTPMGKEIDAWVSTAEAAVHLNVVQSRIRQLLGRGQLVGKRSGGIWLVSGFGICQRQRALLRGE